MNRDEQEMALWREACLKSSAWDALNRAIDADAAVAEFRTRYPQQPQASDSVWYDTPPRPGEYFVEGYPCVCWVEEGVIYHPTWDSANERPRLVELPRDGRRVCPITKPPEPTT